MFGCCDASLSQDFRAGIYNTLVSTSIGEEGLDIGEVDLIISFDVPKSPISLVQRMVRRCRKALLISLVGPHGATS